MKKFIIGLIAGISLMMLSASSPQSKIILDDLYDVTGGIRVMVVSLDQHQYVIAYKARVDGGIGIVHKEDCKFCSHE